MKLSSTVPDTIAPRSSKLSVSLVRDFGIILGIVVLVVVLSMSSPRFFTMGNLLNILSQAAPLAIVACGATLAIIAGGFDLSTGAVYALAGVASAMAANAFGAGFSWIFGLLVGLLVGLVNGLVITVLSVNSFVATLASGMIVVGVAKVVSGGTIIAVSEGAFRTLGSGAIFGIRFTTVIFLLLAIVLAVLLHRTVLGRHVFAVGGSAEASRLSGVPVNRVRIITFLISGLCAGAAGVLAASRVAAGQATAGEGIELNAIAAIVIGGTSILGGRGAIWRTVAGVLLLTLIGNGFNVVGVDPFYRSIFTGLIILVAVGVDALARKER